MNNKSYVNSAARVRQRPHKFRRLVKRHRGTTKVIAVSLAFIMAFSMLGANITSIVNLIEAYADHTDNYKQVNNQYVYYTTDLTLYDYKTDSEIKGGSDNNAYDGWNRNSIFNRALYETGYSQVARNGNQWPLYLGLQYPYQKLGNQMIKASGNPYNYSIVVNSEAGTNDNDAGSSGAAIGQVDSKLYDGDITQGGGKVILPYFDEEFLTANLSKVLSAETITSENLDDYKTTSLGSVLKNQKFKFIKYTDGYYKYLSAYDKLTYSGDTFTVGSGGQVYDLSWKNQNGTTHSSKPAFFPYSTKAGSSSPTFGYGAKFEIPFTMSADGKTVTRDSTTGAVTATGVDDIKFKFSGDDDVWVFIDGYLVLDVGGAHGKVSGEINFNKNNPSAHTAAVKGTGYDMQDGKSSVNTSGYSTPGISNLFNNTLKLYSDSTKQHMLTVYYIERGSLESNCEISFNFQIADIVTVANKLNTDDVNSFFLDDTKAVADTEAVEYVMSSNSATSGTTPDKTETTVTDNQKGYVTLSFDTGGNGDIDSKKVIQGTQVVLPKGYKLNKPGYRIKGWSKSSGGTVVNAFSPYTVNTTHTLYAVWEKIPISPMEEPPEPTLVYICSNGKYITSVGFSNYGTIEEGWQYLANMTSVDMSATHYHVRLVSKTGTENNGDNRDHPADNSAYSLDNSTVSNVTYKDNADLVMAESGGFWRWKITGEYSSEVKKYKDYSTYVNNDNDRKLHVGTDYSANQWVEDYYDKYNTLKTYCQAYKYTTNTDIRSKYKTAVEKYKNLKYNDSNTADQYNTAIGNLVSAINTYNQNYTTQYYYSNGAEEYAEFYVFSSTTPTVTPDNHYGTYADNNSDTSCNLITVTKLEQGEVPEGHAEPADATGDYYKIKVPMYVMAQEYDKTTTPYTAHGDPESFANTITVSANSGADTITMTAEEFIQMPNEDGYPCWYAADGLQKGITDPAPTFQMSNTASVWVYAEGGTPTVNCVNPYTGKTTSASVTRVNDDPADYYRVEIYKTVTKFVNGESQGSQNTNISVGGHEESTSGASGAAPCYFATSHRNGWYNIVTAVANIPSWWQDQCYIYIAGGPLKTSEWDDARAMIRIDSTHYYCWLPSYDTLHIFRSKYNSDQAYQTKDEVIPNGLTADTYYSGINNGGNGKCYCSNTYTITSDNNNSNAYWTYTATNKTAQMTGTLQDPVVTRSIQPLDPESSEDPDTTGDPDTQNVPDTTGDPDTQNVPDTTGDPDTQNVPDTTDDLDTQNDPDTAVNPDTNGDTAPKSGSTGLNGQFQGTADGSYTKVGATGFKLYDPLFKDITNGAQEYAVRMTDNNGKYNLMFGQSAKFSYQFLRGSKLKVAQTGTSYAFSSAERRAGTTEKGGTVTFNGTVGNVQLYNRYSTTYKITDMVGNTSTNGTNNAKYITTNEYGSNGSDNASLTLVNLDNTGSADEGTQLDITYTNKVRVGTLQIKKTFSQSTLDDLKAKYNQSNDPTFYFQVTFSNVFGSTNNAAKLYTGAFKVTTTANTTGTAGTYQKVNENTEQEVTYCIPFKFSDVYDVNSDNYTGYTATIEGIPVYTKYTLTEIFPTGDTSGITLGKVTEKTKKTGSTETELTVTSNVVQTSTITTTKTTTSNENSTTDTDVDSAAYYNTDSDASVFILTAENGENDAYIYIGKKINQLYYHTKTGEGDNPAGLYNRAVTVGGATSSPNDYNGYEEATEAEQSFIYKIEQFANDADMASATPTATFYEVISFDKNASINTYYYKKIKADPNSDYRITELTDWSWKYTPAGLNVQSAAVTTAYKVATVKSFGTVNFTPQTGENLAGNLILNSVGNTPTGDQANSAILAFTNNRNTGKKDIEGDTSIKRNQIYIKAS